MSKDRDIRRLHPSARYVAKYIAQKTFQLYYLEIWLKFSWGFYEDFFTQRWIHSKCNFMKRTKMILLQNGIKYIGLIQDQWSCPSKNNCKMACARESFHKASVHRETFYVQANVSKIPSNEKERFFKSASFCKNKLFTLYIVQQRGQQTW